jgi:hypothetical protein
MVIHEDDHEKRARKRFKKITHTLQKDAKATGRFIEKTAKWAGKTAEKIEGPLDAFALANPEFAPWLAPVAGAVTAVAETQRIIDGTSREADKPNPNPRYAPLASGNLPLVTTVPDAYPPMNLMDAGGYRNVIEELN